MIVLVKYAVTISGQLAFCIIIHCKCFTARQYNITWHFLIKDSMLWIVKASLQSGFGYDPQSGLSRFVFVYASFLILTAGMFPLSKKCSRSFHAWKKKKTLMEAKCLTEIIFCITAHRIWFFRSYFSSTKRDSLFMCPDVINLYTTKEK